MSGKGYAINTEDDDVVIVLPSGKMDCLHDAGVLKTYPINEKGARRCSRGGHLEDYVEGVQGAAKQTVIMDGDVPMVIIRDGKTEATIINYGGIGKKQDLLVANTTFPLWCAPRRTTRRRPCACRRARSTPSSSRTASSRTRTSPTSPRTSVRTAPVGMDADVDLSKPEEYANVAIDPPSRRLGRTPPCTTTRSTTTRPRTAARRAPSCCTARPRHLGHPGTARPLQGAAQRVRRGHRHLLQLQPQGRQRQGGRRPGLHQGRQEGAGRHRIRRRVGHRAHAFRRCPTSP